MSQILIITGDGGESYEALYAVHRFEEEGWKAVVAAPSQRRLNLVMHDFKPGWDTYIERRGYGLKQASHSTLSRSKNMPPSSSSAAARRSICATIKD